MSAASSCCSVGSQIRHSFLRCWGSRLSLLSMMTDISGHFRVSRRHKAVQVVRKYSKVSLVSACVFLSILPSELLPQLFSVPFLNDSLHQLKWCHQMRLIDHWSWKSCGWDSLDAFDWPWISCGLRVDSHDVVRWLTHMKILLYCKKACPYLYRTQTWIKWIVCITWKNIPKLATSCNLEIRIEASQALDLISIQIS